MTFSYHNVPIIRITVQVKISHGRNIVFVLYLVPKLLKFINLARNNQKLQIKPSRSAYDWTFYLHDVNGYGIPFRSITGAEPSLRKIILKCLLTR